MIHFKMAQPDDRGKMNALRLLKEKSGKLNMRLKEIFIPESPSENEVVVKIAFSGVGALDLHIMEGHFENTKSVSRETFYCEKTFVLLVTSRDLL